MDGEAVGRTGGLSHAAQQQAQVAQLQAQLEGPMRAAGGLLQGPGLPQGWGSAQEETQHPQLAQQGQQAQQAQQGPGIESDANADTGG